MRNIRHNLLLSFTLLLSLLLQVEAANSTIHGYVLDKDTRQPFVGAQIEVFSFTDNTKLVSKAYTDEKGHYNVSVPAGDTYDIYVRLGKVNPHESVYVGEGYVQRVDFEVSMKSVSKGGDFIEDNSLHIVLAVAAIVLAVILFDQIRIRGKRKRKQLEKEKTTKEKSSELEKLIKKRAEMEEMIALTKNKYHRREIDDQSFREIMRDYQKKLIEVEAKIRETQAKD